MRTNDKQRQEVTLERRICDRCRDVDGLTFGYIGNFESWGDDRKLFIWIDEDDMREKNGNQASLWECVARDLNVKDASLRGSRSFWLSSIALRFCSCRSNLF